MCLASLERVVEQILVVFVPQIKKDIATISTPQQSASRCRWWNEINQATKYVEIPQQYIDKVALLLVAMLFRSRTPMIIFELRFVEDAIRSLEIRQLFFIASKEVEVTSLGLLLLALLWLLFGSGDLRGRLSLLLLLLRLQYCPQLRRPFPKLQNHKRQVWKGWKRACADWRYTTVAERQVRCAGFPC